MYIYKTRIPGGLVVKNLPKIQETQVWFLGWEDSLEKQIATHSSVLAWRIPGLGEPGGLPSMGSHRVRHDWSDLAAAAAAVRGYKYHENNRIQLIVNCCLVDKSCLSLLQPHRLKSTRLLCPWDFPGKNTGVGCYLLLQGIFSTQESNLCLLNLRQILYH